MSHLLHPLQPTTPFRSQLVIVFFIAVLCLIVCLASQYITGIDYLPLIWAIQLETKGLSSYGPEMAALFQEYYDEPYASGGFAYPLTALWLALPVAFLPESVQKTVWLLLSVGSIILGMKLLRMPASLFLFTPLIRGIAILQNSVLLIGLSLIAIWAMRQKRWPLLAWLTVLIGIAKPQTSLFVAIFFCIALFRAKAWKYLFIPTAIFVGVPFLIEPTWINSWLVNAQIYNRAVSQIWLWYWIPIALFCFWQKQFWPGIALLQVSFFPTLSQPYPLLPLLFAYIDIRSNRHAWIIVISSWSVLFFNQLLPFWLVLLLCYVVPLIWVVWRQNNLIPSQEKLTP